MGIPLVAAGAALAVGGGKQAASAAAGEARTMESWMQAEAMAQVNHETQMLTNMQQMYIGITNKAHQIASSAARIQ